MTDILKSDNLATLPGVEHAFFTKIFGNPGLSRDVPREQSLPVRAKMASYLRVTPQHLLTCYQIHSTQVIVLDRKISSTQYPFDSNDPKWTSDERPKGDALVTNIKDLALGVLTADCVPVLFADIKNGVIGAAHAGWRGALSGILDQTLVEMEKLGSNRKNISAALGPCIWQKSYEVGPEFPAPFLAENPDHQCFFRPAFRSDHYMFDLPGYVVARLKNMGVGSVEPSPADTCAEPDRFFSHRYSTLHQEERQGNLMSAIALI